MTRQVELEADDPIRRVDVFKVTSYFDGDQYEEIKRGPVLTVEIPRSGP